MNSNRMMRCLGVGCWALAVAVWAQEGVDARPPGRMPFFVYRDGGSSANHFTPSGYMGDYSDLALNQNCRDKPADGETCIRVKYNARQTQGQRWAGVYWQDPPNNFGTMKNGGYNLAAAKRIKFMARGEKGGEIIEFGCGGISGEYPDSFIAGLPPETLGTQWREYTIELDGLDLSVCQGGFKFVLQQEKHPEGAVFYIDNIRFE